jgi:hypothetical protein
MARGGPAPVLPQQRTATSATILAVALVASEIQAITRDLLACRRCGFILFTGNPHHPQITGACARLRQRPAGSRRRGFFILVL